MRSLVETMAEAEAAVWLRVDAAVGSAWPDEALHDIADCWEQCPRIVEALRRDE